MRILHVLNSRRFSGAENVVCQIMRMFENDKSMEMAYCSPTGPIQQHLEENNIRYYPVNKLNYIELRRAISKFKPDIIHAHDKRAGCVSSLFAHSGIRVISHIHCTFDALARIKPQSLLYLFATVGFGHIFFVSKPTFESFVFGRIFPKKCSVLLNVIDIDDTIRKAAADGNEYQYQIVYLGRLDIQKNPLRVIEVMRLALRKCPSLKMAMIGDGELMDQVRERIMRDHLEGQITTLGFMPNPYKVLKSARVLLMTSLFEGTPMCSLEAMALGVPIVSTPTDGLKDVVTDGVTGFLSDDNNVLARRVVDICTDDQLHNQLAEASLEKAAILNDTAAYRSNLLEIYMKELHPVKI